MRLGEILRLAALRAPRKAAVIAGDEEITFAEFDRLANRFAHFLLATGVRPGDRVACLLFNSLEYGVVHFGNARAGGVLVHIPPRYAAAEVADILERSDPRILVVDEEVRDRVPDSFGGVLVPVGARGLRDVLADAADPPPALVRPDDPVAMTFTGGATGRPKGALVSHRARYLSALSTAFEHGLTDRDVVGVVTPMSHAVGLMIWFQAAIVAGATSVLFRKWDPGDFVAETGRRRITAVFLVPVQVRDLLRAPAFDAGKLASLVNLGAGGAPTPPGLMRAWREQVPHCGYTDHYGQSETGPLTILKPWDSACRPGAIGQAAHGVELRIVDREGKPVVPGATGELVARGPFLMKEYFRDPGETARYFRQGDGWGWTGDLGFRDADGFVTLVGRSVEKIVSGGISVHPREIEAGLETHPAVEDCAVFGVPDERWGEAPIAIVEARGEVDAEELIRHLAGRIARYKRPREIVFVTRIPRTPSGKVRKGRLREAYLGREPDPGGSEDGT